METVLTLAAMNAELLNRMLADVPQELMCRQLHGVKNHAAWQVGHLAFVRAGMAQVLGAEPVLGPEWQGKFGRGTEPVDDPAAYPSKEQLLAAYARAHRASVEAIRRADDATLDGPTPLPGLAKRFPTKRLLIIGMFGSHEGLHLGQLSVWRRLVGLPRVL